MKNLRPTDSRTLHVYRCGPSANHLQFLTDEKEPAYYLERPAGGVNPMFDRAWNYLLYKGTRPFNVGHEPIFVLRRNQRDANIQFFRGNRDFIFALEWAGKGDVGGLAAAPRQHNFYWKGNKYKWNGKSHLTGTDFVCKDAGTEAVVAYFRAVMLPQSKEGKLEISTMVNDETLEAAIVATFIAYREWSIRRQMLMFGDPYFNQSVTG